MKTLLLCVCLCMLPGSPQARAGEGSAAFVLSIGVNRGVDADLAPLRYADDDAARTFELFRLLGAQVVLLSSLDAETAALHPQAQAEARAATRAELVAAAEALAEPVRRARARGISTVFYLVFAGHGNLRQGRGYLVLEDARLSGPQLAELVRRVGAERSHLIIDACASFFLAFARGPGGERRPLSGFAEVPGLTAADGVGLLLSGSSVRESHEWEGFQAGVFSHEVRSALSGGADADGDGRVSYHEVAAFVERANAAIPNERFRPRVYARPPQGSEVLSELPLASRRTLSLAGAPPARYFLEDARGVRLLDVHPQAGSAPRLLIPASGETLYLHRQGSGSADAGAEYAIPPGSAPVALSDLEPNSERARQRGAAHEAFARLFSEPFGPADAEAFRLADKNALAGILEEGRPSRWRPALGLGTLALSFALAGAGAGMSAYAAQARAGATAGESQQAIAERNQLIRDRNLAAGILYGTAGAAFVAGLLLLIWPEGDGPAIGFGADGPLFVVGGRF